MILKRGEQTQAKERQVLHEMGLVSEVIKDGIKEEKRQHNSDTMEGTKKCDEDYQSHNKVHENGYSQDPTQNNM